LNVTTALQFSGGKDSRAVLHMFREQLNDILVVWADTGASYPAVRKHMEELRSKVPHFLIVTGKQPENIKKYGYPSDVVPINYTPLGKQWVKKSHDFKIQSAFDCCAMNMWHPLNDAMKLLGIKTVIRGQRRDEQYTAKITDGHVDTQGITYRLPIENWTVEQVFEYLKTNSVEVPDYYSTEATSHDCWNCTAYLGSYEKRIANLPPEQKAEVERRLQEINQAIDLESAPLKKLLKAG
jgi:phosphoadenosine phosphosulfate reductase